MKAFTFYLKEEIEMRQLLRKLQDYGTCNCDFVTFVAIYQDWHLKAFPGTPVNFKAATFRDDWFKDFVEFLANKNI